MSAARDRLASGYYNGNPVSVANPGGMDDDGHETNFPAALKDVGDVGAEIVADNAAAVAAILADNASTALAVAGSATDANNSKIAAAGSEASAAALAASAAGSAATSLRVVAANFPDRVDATASFFTEALTGDPAAVASAPGAKLSNVAGFGYVYRSTGAASLAHKGVMTAGAEYVIEISIEVEQVSIGAGETPAARIRLQGLDKDYASTGAAVTGPLVVTPVGVTTITRRFAYVAPAGGSAWPQPGSAVWLRPAVDINRKSDDSGAAALSVAQVRRMSVRDVTAVVAAELAAAAAAASASTLTYATHAEALAATRIDRIVSPAEAKAMIDYYIPFPVGSYAKFAANPGPPWIAKDGKSYLISTYPGLAAALGVKHAPAPTVATGSSPSAFGMSSWNSVGYSPVTGEYFVLGSATSTGSATLLKKARTGGSNAAPIWSTAGWASVGVVANGLGGRPFTLGVVGAHNVVAFATTLGLGVWNITTSAFWISSAGFDGQTGAKIAIGKGLVVARTNGNIGVASAATANNQMAFAAKAAVPAEGATPGLGVEFNAALNAFVSCTKGSTTIVTSSDAAAATWTQTATPAPVAVQDFCVTSSGHVFVLGVANDLWVTADLVTWKKAGRFPAAGSVNRISSIGGLGAGCSDTGYLFDANGINVELAHAAPANAQVAWDGKGMIEVQPGLEAYRSFSIDLTTQFSVGETNADSPQAYWKAA